MQETTRVKLTVGIIVLLMTALVAGFVHRMLKPTIFTPEQMVNYGGIFFDKPRMFRDMDLLLDQQGQPFNKANLQGKWTLIFFGFTYCPDVCPTTLGILNKFYKEWQEKYPADAVQVVMVSVDPARDSVEKMRDYVAYFNPAFVGITGDYMALVRFTGDLSAGFTKVPLSDGNYLMEHSGNIAVINPRGDFHGFFKPPFDPVRLRLALSSVLAQYRRDYGE